MGGGGGGGVVRGDWWLNLKRTSRSLSLFLSLSDTELQSSRLQTKNSFENLKFVR